MRRPVEISGADFLLTLRFEPENHADHFRGLSCNVPGALRASYRYRLQADFRYFTLGLKLNAIDAALDLKDLRLPPSNRLENLKGDREGQHSIRINDQWRICFVWRDGHAERVEIVDYHYRRLSLRRSYAYHAHRSSASGRLS